MVERVLLEEGEHVDKGNVFESRATEDCAMTSMVMVESAHDFRLWPILETLSRRDQGRESQAHIASSATQKIVAMHPDDRNAREVQLETDKSLLPCLTW